MSSIPHPPAEAAPAPPLAERRAPRFAPEEATVPRVFQILVVLYVVITGEIPQAIQGAFFGMTGGGETAFTVALLTALLVDLARVAPLFVLARHPLGILHPLIVAVVLWPLLVRMPATIEEWGGLGGLFLGIPVEPPFFMGLGWRPAAELWRATALYNALQFVSLMSIYAGFALVPVRRVREWRPTLLYRPDALRRLLIVLIGLSLVALLALIYVRGGLGQHLADMARGRFRSLAGLGPLIALVDLGTICMVVWTAARPQDGRSPWFLGSLAAVAAAQFLSNGSRSGMLLLIMIVGLTWALRTRRIPWRLAAIMAPLIFLSLGFLNLVRTSGLEGQSASEAITGSDTGQAFARIQEEIAARESISAAVPVVAEGFRVTEGPLLGQTYLAAILGFVPRRMWEDKPRGPGSLYAQYFLGEVREGTSIPTGPVAEAYWNFHILGVILLFFLYGLLLKKVHDLFSAKADSPFVLAFFVLFATTFRIGTDDLVAFQQQMVLLLFVYVLARIFASQRVAPAGVILEPRPPRPA